MTSTHTHLFSEHQLRALAGLRLPLWSLRPHATKAAYVYRIGHAVIESSHATPVVMPTWLQDLVRIPELSLVEISKVAASATVIRFDEQDWHQPSAQKKQDLWAAITDSR